MDDQNLYECSFKSCNRKYSTKYSLQRHFFIKHKKSKRFTCKICKKILSSNQNLKEHSYTHSDEKPLICPFAGCQKLFRQSSQLSAHKKIHLYSVNTAGTGWSLGFKLEMDRRISELLKSEESELNHGLQGPQSEFLTIPKIFEPEDLKLRLDIPK